MVETDLGVVRLSRQVLRKDGNLSSTYEGFIPNGTRVAVKFLRGLSESGLAVWLDPTVILDPSYIVPHEIICTDIVSTCYISDWFVNGNIESYLNGKPESFEGPLIMDIASALDYIHSLKPPIIHSNLKPDNILIDKYGRAKLAEVGVARFLEKTSVEADGGSHSDRLIWLAPEVLNDEGYTVKSDLYAFALVALSIRTRRLPVRPQASLAAIVRERCTGQLPHPSDFPGLPPQDPLWNVLRSCWALQHPDRPSASQICLLLGDTLKAEEVAEDVMTRPIVIEILPFNW